MAGGIEMANITITLSAWDSGCLPGVLRTRIQETERHRAIAGHLYPPEEAENIEKFLGQMRACLAAVERARADFYKVAE